MLKRNTVALVDTNDNTLGVSDKLAAHQQGLLHRAFSVMLYRYNINNKLEFLLQKRAKIKYHCGGLWTNTCCSHPGAREDLRSSALSRLQEELVDINIINLSLEAAGCFIYKAEFTNGLTEHEYDHVFVAEYNAKPVNYNKDEICELSWIEFEQIQLDYDHNPSKYTPWFAQVLDICFKYIKIRI
ncbi:MAG: isopentenyl-diphosphate Delta-isomerase [Gammaproteobacteria bacterium]|nr:isopentenyl-diphosphate Delta-isomerase [Gammaproteobacteria bacterium]